MRNQINRFSLLGLLLMLISTLSMGASIEVQSRAKQVWQLLDYVAVDYAGAVKLGQVTKESEYAEMQEFVATAQQQLNTLPATGDTEKLQGQLAQLMLSVADKVDSALVATQARALANSILTAYPFPIAPSVAPDLSKGAQLFQANCSACHGAQGHGDGSMAASLDPKPTALSDRTRARERSLLALHQVISSGVEGTAMPSFVRFSDDDRWALAFFVGTLSYSDEDKTAGAQLWQSDRESHTLLTNLESLTQTSEHLLANQVGADSAKAVMAYLRATPRALAGNSTTLAKTKLAESLLAAQRDDRVTASQLALSAYLDGFEPVEPALAARNRDLFERIEAGMVAYRAAIGKNDVASLQASETTLIQLLAEADMALAPSPSDAVATFVGALTILLREGLEALLVVVAMIAFLKKAERQDVLVYVHWGWVSALVMGGVTWLVATYLVSISGASRELTEGFSSLFAAVVLLGVGMWMHQKSVAGRWQLYLKEKLSAALNRRTAWFLFSLAFIAVYREVFETVLFYAALWSEGNGWSMLAGLGAGALILAIVAAVLLRTSARLPISQFFAASSLLVAVLAVVLAGKGIAGLQEAGWLHSSPVTFPRIDILGIYPSLQTLLAQAAVLAMVIIAFFINVRTAESEITKEV